MTAVSLTTLRQRFGKLMRAYRSGTATSGGSVNFLECTTHPFRTTYPETDYQDWWLLRPDATDSGDRVRRIAPLAYHAESGRFTPDAPWTNAPASGEAFELHGYGLDPASEASDAINQALKQILVPARFWVGPPEDGDELDGFSQLYLSDEVGAWLTDPKWIRQVTTLGEATLRPVSVAVQLDSTDPALEAARNSGVLATFFRDRTRGGIARVQWASTAHAGGDGTVEVAWPRATTEGNLLLLAVVAVDTITTPSGWTEIGTSISGSLRTALFYQEAAASQSGTVSIDLGNAVRACAMLAEYQGVRPSDSLDQSTTTSGGHAVGPTAASTEGDELYVAILGRVATSPVSNPTNRFQIVETVSSPETLHTTGAALSFLERVNPRTDLRERGNVGTIGGGRYVQESGLIGIDLGSGIVSPSFAVVEALRPAYTYARADATGEFGTKTDGLTAEGNQVDVVDELLVVQGAMVWAYEQWPRFRSAVEEEPRRLQELETARRRWYTTLRNRTPRLARTLRPLESWGM